MKNRDLIERNHRLSYVKGIIFSIVMIVLITLPYTIWYINETQMIDAVIIDKTVPDQTYREHKGIVWILNNLKFFNQHTQKPFEYQTDYYGFFPKEGDQYEMKGLPEKMENPDLIYLADAYGVYSDDLNRKNERGSRSNLIYGGMQIDEVNKLKSILKDNIIISEFNTLAAPTSDRVRNEIEKIFGITWSGWIGRYFTDLSEDNTEIPLWLINAYEMQYLKRWDFKGPGFAFVRSDDTVIILNLGSDVGKGLNRIGFHERYLEEFQVKNHVNYDYWFDIVEPMPDTEIIAAYQLDLTDAGKEKLNAYGLKSEFPAIIRKKEGYTSYYFAGDYADNDKIPSRYNLSGIQFLNKISTIRVEGNQDYFYWNVYYPMMKSILNELR